MYPNQSKLLNKRSEIVSKCQHENKFLLQTLQKCSPGKMFCKHEANPQENNDAEVQCQQSCFGTLMKSHPHMGAPLKIHSTPTEHPPTGEHLWGTASVCQNNFKRLEL